ncbi:MAG: hypothetical protein JSW71_12050 [Gemmatimonadota bacterium]|nr:MAG: hypothetical protein JSW71_12050 [Gemmatimonadota bacterium]
MIDVQRIDSAEFEVTVVKRVTTRHQVTLNPSYYNRLTKGEVPEEMLVRKSLEFLLEREPNTSILRRFDLSVIGDYFPEYERRIRQML